MKLSTWEANEVDMFYALNGHSAARYVLIKILTDPGKIECHMTGHSYRASRERILRDRA